MKEEKDYKQIAKHLIAMWEDKRETIYSNVEQNKDIDISDFKRQMGRAFELDNCIMDVKIFFDLIEVDKCK